MLTLAPLAWDSARLAQQRQKLEPGKPDVDGNTTRGQVELIGKEIRLT